MFRLKTIFFPFVLWEFCPEMFFGEKKVSANFFEIKIFRRDETSSKNYALKKIVKDSPFFFFFFFKILFFFFFFLFKIKNFYFFFIKFLKKKLCIKKIVKDSPFFFLFIVFYLNIIGKIKILS